MKSDLHAGYKDYELVQLLRAPACTQHAHKRTRTDVEREERMGIIREFIAQIEHDGMKSTLRSLLSEDLHVLLSEKPDATVCNIVVEFRMLLKRGEEYLRNNDLEPLYYLLVDDLAQLLRNSAQYLLLWHLGVSVCNNSPS